MVRISRVAATMHGEARFFQTSRAIKISSNQSRVIRYDTNRHAYGQMGEQTGARADEKEPVSDSPNFGNQRKRELLP